MPLGNGWMDYAKPGIDIKFPRLMFYEPLFALLNGVQNPESFYQSSPNKSILSPIANHGYLLTPSYSGKEAQIYQYAF